MVDILHTSDKKRGGRIYFTQQHVGEIISAPLGTYRFELIIQGVHLGREFNIPIAVMIKYNGGMDISKIEPDTRFSNRYLRSIILEIDNQVIKFKKSGR